MLNRLVTVSIITHIHDLHFAYLMDYTTIITVIEQRRHIEYGIHHCVETGLPSHQVDQSLWVMEDRPGIMPAISFRKGIPPFQRVERRLECTVFITTTHQLGFLIEQVLIIHGMFGKNCYFRFRFTQCFSQFIDGPVIVSIF